MYMSVTRSQISELIIAIYFHIMDYTDPKVFVKALCQRDLHTATLCVNAGQELFSIPRVANIRNAAIHFYLQVASGEKISEAFLSLIALKDVVSLTGKLTDSQRDLPEGLPEIPRELSFWIAAHLGGAVADEQQNLLEMQDTSKRLLREYEMLDHTRKQLAARTALKETLKNTDQANT